MHIMLLLLFIFTIYIGIISKLYIDSYIHFMFIYIYYSYYIGIYIYTAQVIPIIFYFNFMI